MSVQKHAALVIDMGRMLDAPVNKQSIHSHLTAIGLVSVQIFHEIFPHMRDYVSNLSG